MMHRMNATRLKHAAVCSMMPALGFARLPPAECHMRYSRKLLATRRPSFATSLRHTSVPTGLRTMAKGCRALARLPWYLSPHLRKANPLPSCSPRSPAASAKRPAAHLLKSSLGRLKPSSATSPRHASAPKGLRNSAQGQPSLSEATLGISPSIREANPAPSSHTAHTSSGFTAPPPLPRAS